MQRRDFAKIVTAAVAAPGAGCLGGSSGASNGRSYNFLQSSNIESVEWINLDVLRVHFRDDHDIDGIGIQHAHDDTDDIHDDLYIRGAPRFGGHRDFPIVDKIRGGTVVYPNRRFEIVEYEGSIGGLNLVTGIVGTDAFVIPESIAPPDKFASIERTAPPRPDRG